MGVTIAISNNKGGVGKTTTTVNTAHGLLLSGAERVLVIDLDLQANATFTLGHDKDSKEPNIYDALCDKESLPIYEHTRIENLHYCPAGRYAVEEILDRRMNREMKLKKLLDPIKDLYDYILIDCPPSLGLLTTNAMVAADKLIIPVQLEPYAYIGTGAIVNRCQEVRNELNSALVIAGYVRTIYESRLSQTKELEKLLLQSVPEDKVFRTVIRKNISLSEASLYMNTIFEYDRTSAGAEDYLSLSKEIAQLPK